MSCCWHKRIGLPAFCLLLTLTTSHSTLTTLPDLSVANVCDELRCRSPISQEIDSPDCWAMGGEYDPFSCEGENYEGVVMESIPPYEIEGYALYYYTCCPPNAVDSITNTTLPQCDPSWDSCSDEGGDCHADGPFEPMTCSDEVNDYFKYPRKTGYTFYHYSWKYYQYRCCTTPAADDKHFTFIPELILFILATFGFVLSLSMCISILIAPPAVRYQAFNIYMVLSAMQNALSLLLSAAVLSAITAFSKTSSYHSCHISVFGISFSAGSTLWMDSIISHEIFLLLKKSKQRMRAKPPKIKKVLKQFGVVWLAAGAMGVWNIHLYCTGTEEWGSAADPSELLNTLHYITYSVVTVPPFFYMAYLVWKVWSAGLLPKSGRTRVLYFYFLRIVMIAILYIPIHVLGILEPLNYVEGSHYIIYYLLCIQCIISVLLMITKPDIRLAFLRLWTCDKFSISDTSTDERDFYSTNCFSSTRQFEVKDSDKREFHTNAKEINPSATSKLDSQSQDTNTIKEENVSESQDTNTSKKGNVSANEKDDDDDSEVIVFEEGGGEGVGIFDTTAIKDSIWALEDDW